MFGPAKLCLAEMDWKQSAIFAGWLEVKIDHQWYLKRDTPRARNVYEGGTDLNIQNFDFVSGS